MKNEFPFFRTAGIDFNKLDSLDKGGYTRTRDEVMEFISCLQNNGAEITILTPDEEDAYMQSWFKRVVPEDKRQKALDFYCFDKDGVGGYLWHVFSFEILDCIREDDAKVAFDSTSKQEAVLLSNGFGITSCRIRNISNIKADSFDLLADVIVTDCNFEWTYVKTHEGQCGPYFHNIRKT